MITKIFRAAAVIAIAPSVVACASLDELATGRTDRLSRAPFYVTYRASGAPTGIAALPVAIDPVSGEPFNMAGREAVLAPLLQALNEALASHACCQYVVDTGLRDGKPTLYVGSLDGEHAPAGTGVEQLAHEEYAPMILHIAKPADEWRRAARAAATRYGIDRLIVIYVAFTQYPKADSGAFGKKVVLGTGYEQPVRFLSAVDRPVEVVQLTGMLLDSDGNILRAGAEGIAGYDTPFLAQVFEADRDIRPQAIERLLNEEKRDDLPGRPLKWQVALDNLIEQLLD